MNNDRTRLKVSRKKAKKILKRSLELLNVLIVDDRPSPQNGTELKYRRDEIAVWSEATNQEVLNIFENYSANELNPPYTVYRKYSGYGTSFDQRWGDNFRAMLEDQSTMKRLRARVQSMPVIPWWERWLGGFGNFIGSMATKQIRWFAFLILLLIILFSLMLLFPERFGTFLGAIFKMLGFGAGEN